MRTVNEAALYQAFGCQNKVKYFRLPCTRKNLWYPLVATGSMVERSMQGCHYSMNNRQFQQYYQGKIKHTLTAVIGIAGYCS